MPFHPTPHEGPTFNIDAFVRDIATMTQAITLLMRTERKELSRVCLKRIGEPGGVEEIETAAEALLDLSKRAQAFSGLAMQAWLFLRTELNDPGGRA